MIQLICTQPYLSLRLMKKQFPRNKVKNWDNRRVVWFVRGVEDRLKKHYMPKPYCYLGIKMIYTVHTDIFVKMYTMSARTAM